MTEQINRWIADHRDEFLKELHALCSFPSVRGEAEAGCPFGKPAAEVLNYALELGKRYGFATDNVDNYAGEITLGDDPTLGILAHLDVVPLGTGWTMPPFAATVKGDKVYGRGVIDDKGPALAALFAMRCIKELGLPLKHGVRLILGTDEECGSSDMEHYGSKRRFPPQVFTPDGSYPIINVEFGRLHACFEAPVDPHILEINGGVVINAVPCDADALVDGVDASNVPAAVCGLPVTVEREGDALRLRVKGVSAHASTPDKGKNALTALLTLLNVLFPEADGVAGMHNLFPYGDNDGSAAGIACADETGALTMVFSVIHREGDRFVGAADVRLPVCATPEGAETTLKETFTANGLFPKPMPGVGPHCVPADSPFVQTLLRVFEEQTGQKGECIAIGGGTYVHEIEGGVAFGAEFEGSEYNMHGADENVPIDELMTDIRIQAAAIAALCG